MSFHQLYEQLREQHKAILDQPCDNPKDQETHDRLARYDHLHQKEGHTLHCACQQVFGGRPCTCKGETTT